VAKGTAVKERSHLHLVPPAPTSPEAPPASDPLAPDRHPNLDFFLADLVVTPKDDIASMEHPVFALKPGDTTIRKYEHNGYFLHVIPSVLGHATIHDKDILIYCISQVVAAADTGGFIEPTRRVRVTAHDLLVQTNRPTDGRGYDRLKEALDRLAGTRVKTNITTNGTRTTEAFGIIDWYRIVEKTPGDGRMIAIDICLSEWSFRAAMSREVLTLDKEYFRLRKALEKRVYELARKHCGAQETWRCSVELLHKKTGARCSLREFRRLLADVVEHQHLPQYQLEVLSDGTARFWNRASGSWRLRMAEETSALALADEQAAYEARYRQEWERDNPGRDWPGIEAAAASERQRHKMLAAAMVPKSSPSKG
jgi:plasmid replication initiation protein